MAKGARTGQTSVQFNISLTGGSIGSQSNGSPQNACDQAQEAKRQEAAREDGEASEEALELIQSAKKALYVGMAEMKLGNRVGDVSAAIQNYVESQGFSVIRDFVGHGIGRSMHEDPQVPNFGKAGRGPKLDVGMVLAIEPMVAAGSWEVDILEDAWTVVTRDHQWSSHYEDTIAITENGPQNLTGAQNYEEEVEMIGVS